MPKKRNIYPTTENQTTVQILYTTNVRCTLILLIIQLVLHSVRLVQFLINILLTIYIAQCNKVGNYKYTDPLNHSAGTTQCKTDGILKKTSIQICITV